MTRSNSPDKTTRFAGLTNHNQTELSNKAEPIVDMDSDDLPKISLATAIRDLEQAEAGKLAWKVPENVAEKIDPRQVDENLPDEINVVPAGNGSIYVETDRFQSVYSPEKLRSWLTADNDELLDDALWHVPTQSYSIVNPLTAYEPLEEAIQNEDYGGNIFGEIREYKGGGEVHMNVLFDNFTINYNDNNNGNKPIVLGIRTGYDFFGGQALYFEGYAQDRKCDNSIRSITEKKTIRHVGDVNLEDEVSDVLEEMELMTNRLAELIEMAEDIEVDMLEMDFAEAFDHDDNFRGFYELAGFPSYIASAAANHARQRADNVFTPDMTDLWDGATYALTHTFSGGEGTATAQDYIDSANDMVMNPSQTLGQVNREHQTRMERQSEDGEDALGSETAHAQIEKFTQTVKDKADEFESRNEELRTTLIADANGEDVATDGGE
jgi:hypothetical protein